MHNSILPPEDSRMKRLLHLPLLPIADLRLTC